MEKSDWEKLVDNLTRQGVLKSPKTTQAIRSVPRALFLPPENKVYGASDAPLPIGFGQTVSAPCIVSLINEALQLEVGNKVLEVGTGSGWHAATIAELVTSKDTPRSEWGHVYTVEIIQALAETVRRNIMNAGYGDRVTIINADGSKGHLEKAPYDRILVSASASEVPAPLLEQLKSGGKMVIPLGNASFFQVLTRITKDNDGKVQRENLSGVSFDPLTNDGEQK
jgi:protein-L-isoaspartate(D-aspartate) O-methyltransferase